MANSYFRFQQFEIQQDQCAHKVGTDGVLLACWAEAASPQRILDIGSGSGLISLILAQRFPDASITALEIDPASFRQGQDNIQSSPFADRINSLQGNFTEYPLTSTYDLIVSNPPFFGNKVLSGQGARDQARHQLSMTHLQLMQKAGRLLTEEGEICLILPSEDAETLINQQADHGLYLRSGVKVSNKPQSAVKRYLMQWGKMPLHTRWDSLSIRGENGEYSTRYRSLSRDFYLPK